MYKYNATYDTYGVSGVIIFKKDKYLLNYYMVKTINNRELAHLFFFYPDNRKSKLPDMDMSRRCFWWINASEEDIEKVRLMYKMREPVGEDLWLS